MRRLSIGLFFVLALLLSLSLPHLAAQENAIGVLQLVDSDPQPGQELGLAGPITLYFDRSLNCQTKAAYFFIEPAVEGNLVCEGTSLTFLPSREFSPATTYSVQVLSTLVGVDGATLTEDIRLQFNTTGFLAVSEVFPASGGDVPANSVITVIFNRPVVPLVAVEDMGSLPQPLRLEPEVRGTGEWLNTSIFVFKPERPLAGGTDYTAIIQGGLTATDGAVLPEPYAWSFGTALPEVVEVYPLAQANRVKLDSVIQVRFNQPMSREEVEAAFFVRPDVDADVPSVRGGFRWANDNMGFEFKPDQNLIINMLYVVGFSDSLTLAGMSRWSFATVPLPAIIATDPFDGQVEASPYGGITLYFASPMDIDTLAEKIAIEPKPWRDPEYFYRDWDDSYQVSFPTEPSTDYRISIAPGMADIYGNTIQSSFSFGYTTAAYPSEVILDVPGPVGFYNAAREQTQLFLRHRNISSLDLSLYGIPLIEFVGQLTGDYYWNPTENYVPRNDMLLRSWRIDASGVPENVLRYQLLTMGGSGGTAGVSCPSSPPSRLKVGDSAMVITEPDPVRARATAPDGEIVELLYKGYALQILSGPVCANDLLWWEVQLRNEQRAWIAEGIGQEYFIESRVPATTQITLPEIGEDGKLPSGVYLLNVLAPELQELGYPAQKHFLMVSTATLNMKASVDSLTVWATDTQTGQSLAHVPLTVYDNALNVVGTGVTDAQGIAVINTPRSVDLYQRQVVVLDDGTNFGLGMTEWTQGIEPWNFNQNYDYFPRQYSVYLYTDRPIYRTGQPVYFRGVIRSKDDVIYRVPDIQTVPVTITDDQGNTIYEKQLSLTPFGTFSDKIDIAADATLGYYSVNVTLPTQSEFQYEGGSVGFSVAEFRLPEFLVNVLPDKAEVVQGETIQLTVDTQFFFGGAVSNAGVSYSVIADPYYFVYTGDDGYYDFADYNYDEGFGGFFGGFGGVIVSGEGQTDANGKLVIEVPAKLEDSNQSQTFTIEAVVTDESQQFVAGRASVVVHRGQVYVGVRPESYVSGVGEATTAEIISVDWKSEPVAGQVISVSVVERRWSSVQEQDANGRTTWTWEVEEIPLTEGAVTTNAEGRARFTFTPPNGGVFKVTTTTRDSGGNEVRSSTTVWVASDDYVSWRQQNSNRIDLIADKSDYQVGEIAEILITSPFQGSAEAWVTVERGDLLKTERVQLDSNSFVYQVPIEDNFAPNVYVSVLLVKGVDENNPVAAFRMGSLQLGVNIERKEVIINVTPDRERAAPRETVTYTVTTTNYNDEPVTAEVGVGLTDLASLSIAQPNSAPILTYFYGQQGLGVRTSTPLTINTDLLTQTTLDTIKGGGGGGGGGGGVIEIRGNFVDTAYWNATLTTDENGVATFDVTLPDNLTTWRLDARAISNGRDGVMLVGQDTFDLLSTKPLIIRPQTPRFFIVDDHVTLSAVINNNTAQDLTVDVTINATGVTLQSDGTQQVTIPADGRARVTWNVTVNAVDMAQMSFTVSGGGYSDGAVSGVSVDDSGNLPVYRYIAPETVGTAGSLREGGSRTEAILLPQRFDVTQGELTIKLDQSLAASTMDGLDYLENYPHQCTEQTVSKFLPNVMTMRAFDQLGLSDPTLRSNLDSAVNYATQKLYAEQKADGGWGWFLNDRSDVPTTAYALIGLTEAKNIGYPINQDVIIRAQNFLRNNLIVPDLSQPRWRINRQAFVLYALARSGAPDVARTVTLYENRDNLSLYTKAWLAQSLYIIDPNDTARLDVLLAEINNSAVSSATGIYWQEDYRDFYNWNTDTRTTAIVLQTLVLLRPNSELIPNVVRYLMVQRKADAWETTQETAWVVMALTDWMVVSGELNPNYEYTLSLNGTEITSGSATSDTVRQREILQVQVADLLKDQANALVFKRTAGDGALYYTAHLRAFLPVPEIQPLNRGIILERRYTILGDESGRSVTGAKVGEIVQVRLTIIAPNDLHYVMIEDPLPAGAEAINPNLETSQQIGTRPGLDNSNPLKQGWGWWWFSNIEFRDEKVVLYSSYLPAGTYEYVYSIRPGFEGSYNVIPPTGQEFYFPEVYGRGTGSIFTIVPVDE